MALKIAILMLGLLAMLLMVSSEVASTNSKEVADAKYPDGGPGGGGGGGGYPGHGGGGGGGGYPGHGGGGGGGGGYPGHGGGNPGHGHGGGNPGHGGGGYPGHGGGGGGYCRHGCCSGRAYNGGGCRKCCSYAGEAVAAQTHN